MSSLPRWSEVTALFGGAFDPPHLGHRQAVRGLFENPGVRRVWVLPTPTPPHKTSFAPGEERVAMTRLNFSTTSTDPYYPTEVTVDLRELESARRQPERPSYTFDILQELKNELSAMAFAIGTDQLAKLHTWHRFPEVLSLSHWLVLERKPEGEKAARETIGQWSAEGLLTPRGDQTWQIRSAGRGETFLKVVTTEARAVSSTAIRESLARTNEPSEGTLLPEVLAYLKQRRLYGTKEAKTF